jgi:hypothetical protein
MPIVIELSRAAQRMLEDADERWCAEHGLAENPLVDAVLAAAVLLREVPRSA